MIKDRNGNILPEQNDQERFLTFLYCKKPGRLLLRLLLQRKRGKVRTATVMVMMTGTDSGKRRTGLGLR